MLSLDVRPEGIRKKRKISFNLEAQTSVFAAKETESETDSKRKRGPKQKKEGSQGRQRCRQGLFKQTSKRCPLSKKWTGVRGYIHLVREKTEMD